MTKKNDQLKKRLKNVEGKCIKASITQTTLSALSPMFALFVARQPENKRSDEQKSL